MRKILLFILSTLALFGAEIKIAVAANVSYAMDELIYSFNIKYPNIKVLPVFSSSGNLSAQIQNKAPFGLFLSANMKYPEKLYDLGLASLKPVVYAKGSLALFSRKGYGMDGNLSFLNEDKIKSISIANPKTAPYGKASLDALNGANMYKKVNKKLVYAQNVSSSFVYALNVADVGFVAKSSLFSPKVRDKNLKYIDVNPRLYTPIEQGIIMIKDFEKNPHVRVFYDFILSQDAKKIFKKYGYLVDE
ncbi:MAG: molybdate ABC transporter substrate-binding protein [Proteobacteria bacterium]|nr:MAG: molybdate ABC transporter substrate-binding protein [Pseudomonadota bacterium]